MEFDVEIIKSIAFMGLGWACLQKVLLKILKGFPKSAISHTDSQSNPRVRRKYQLSVHRKLFCVFDLRSWLALKTEAQAAKLLLHHRFSKYILGRCMKPYKFILTF